MIDYKATDTAFSFISVTIAGRRAAGRRMYNRIAAQMDHGDRDENRRGGEGEVLLEAATRMERPSSTVVHSQWNQVAESKRVAAAGD